VLSIKDNLRKVRRLIISAAIRSLAKPAGISASSLLIIAPHPDDEVLACGGLIALKNTKNARVSVVFLTEGEASHKGCCNASSDKVAFARRQLAVESGKILGLKTEDMFWLGLPDGNIPDRKEVGFKQTLKRLAKLIDEVKPCEIYVPHYHDCWPDHEAASTVARFALREINSDCDLFYYPVWIWHNLRIRSLPELLKTKIVCINIGPVLDKKKAAVEHYLSALNPDCGKPFCGILPQGFVNHFQYDYEIFFKSDNCVNPNLHT